MSDRLRITFVLPPPDLSGGIRVIATYAARLSDRGHQITLVHPPNRPISLRRKVSSLVKGRGWVPSVRLNASHLDDLTVERRILERWRPVGTDDLPDADVLIATWWETALWIESIPSEKGAKVYFLQHYEAHEPAWVKPVERTWRMPYRKIVVAQWLADLARDRFGDPSAVVVPNSVDVNRFDAPPREKSSQTQVGFAYWPMPSKGSDIAVRAIAIARKRVPNLSALAFGSSPPSQEIPLSEDIRYYYKPSQHEIPKLYAECDAWLFPSRAEGFGLPVLEAMACRTPVIGTPVGAAPDSLTDGRGILVPLENPEAMADAICDVSAMSPDAWRRMSDRAYDSVRRYTWEEATNRFEAALKNAVHGST